MYLESPLCVDCILLWTQAAAVPMIFNRTSVLHEHQRRYRSAVTSTSGFCRPDVPLPRLCRNCIDAHYLLTSPFSCLFGPPLLLTHRWDSSPLQAEDNQPSPHLLPGLSPGLKMVSGLQKEQLLACFHKYIAMVARARTHTHARTCVFTCIFLLC